MFRPYTKVTVETLNIPEIKGEYQGVINQKGNVYLITSYGVYIMRLKFVDVPGEYPDQRIDHTFELLSVFKGAKDDV